MSWWQCSKHGLYGGTQFCPTCGEGGNYAQLEPSSSPIGTDEELIVRLRKYGHIEAADALLSRIAEVELLTVRVRELSEGLDQLLHAIHPGSQRAAAIKARELLAKYPVQA